MLHTETFESPALSGAGHLGLSHWHRLYPRTVRQAQHTILDLSAGFQVVETLLLMSWLGVATAANAARTDA